MTVHVARNGQVVGEYPQQVFNTLLETGKLLPSDHFWMDGMAEWKPISVARSYFGHREKCRHCGGKMSEHKPVVKNVHRGKTKSICIKCGHTEYHP